MFLQSASPSIEGYWGTSPDDRSYPWPVPSMEPWPGRDRFLEALATAEASAISDHDGQGIVVWHAKGFSTCRLCGCINGSSEFRSPSWRWPEGFRHYVEEHGVQPSAAFEDYVLALAAG